MIAQNQFPNYYFAAVDMDTNIVRFDGGSGRWVYTIGWACTLPSEISHSEIDFILFAMMEQSIID